MTELGARDAVLVAGVAALLPAGYAAALHRVQRTCGGPPGPGWRVARGLVVAVPAVLRVGVVLWPLATPAGLSVRR